MNYSPKVSVVMPVYNGEKFLQEAIESILNQTFRDFEFLIVDDGSTDGSEEIISRYADTDERIHLISNPKNLGIAEATNVGVAHARGEYIALMDQDDISHPDRLSTEVAYLDLHPEICVVGGNTAVLGEDGRTHNRRPVLTSPVLIRWGLLFGNQLRNPTVLIRQDIFTKLGMRYENFAPLQDYRFWLKLSMRCWFTNLPENLVTYRLHHDNASISQSDKYSDHLQVTQIEFIDELFGKRISNVSGLSDPSLINNVSEAKEICNIIIAWQKMSKAWNPSKAEKEFIAVKTIQKIRDICHFQKYHITLLPELFYSSWLKIVLP